jgi:hypothetical protein
MDTMKKPSIVLIVLLAGLCTLAQLGTPARADAGIIKNVVLYIPNRVFDLMDIVRFRLRFGPGLSAGVRATTLLSAYAGVQSSLYVGLRGPRGEREIPWPFGFDNRAGAQVSLIDATAAGTYYDPLEFGFEVQPLIFGVNIGIGGFEILDFITGLVFIDLAGDDLGRGSEDEDDADELEGDNETEAGEPEADEPEAVEIEVDETEVIEPEANALEADEPEAVELKADAPEAVEIEVDAPEA